jgi:serine/threonine protein kinase
MARIYIGRATGIGSFERHVVLKMILPERANDETSVQMFLDEARLAASLNHQNVAQVFEVGEDAGIHYLAMEYVHGQDLRALLAKAGSSGTRVPLELALTVVAGAAAGLHHAHERRTGDGQPMGIVHRDVSPSNIMIGYDGAVKLLDFGIAKATSRSVETQSGIIKGKFAYMAPEQCRGRDVDRRSDVFSLGIILYEVTTQHRCFRADSDFDTMHRIVTGDIVRPTRLVQGYPQALEAIVMKALSVDAAQRYQSAGLLLEAIEGFAMASRASLSTMSLGRFMRDMFGDVPEPWLVPGRVGQPLYPREQTISNTNASGDHAVGQPPPNHEEAPLHLSPTSVIDIPRGPDDGDWAGQGYAPPAPPPPVVPERPSHVERSAPFQRASASQLSSPQLPPLRVPSATSIPRPSGGLGIANGSQPIPPAFATHPGSGSGPAHSALPLGAQVIARTRQGYSGAPGISHSEISYPRYEPPPPEPGESVAPNNRLLYAGVAVLLIGIIVLLAISIADSSDDLPAPPPRPTRSATEQPPVPEARPAPAAGGALRPEPVKPEAFRAEVDAGVAAVKDDSIAIHIVSTPPGADVLLAGKPIGTTPLETRLKRGTGQAILTVHRAKFVDATSTIDLTADVKQDVTLVAEDAEARASKPRPAGRDPVPAGRDPARPRDPAKPRTPSAPAAPKCQPPGQYNPFDKGCNGAACPPCG